MNVGELITALQEHDTEKMVYVPNFDETVQLVKRVEIMEHLNLPEGIVITDDVVLLPTFFKADSDEEHEQEEPA